MTSRRPHKKSRLGCLTCKQRRVKCDERTPAPCGPCESRSLDCVYARRPRRPQLLTPSEPSTHSGVSENIVEDGWPLDRRKLELELLHQWTALTHKSYCGTMVDEYENWQILVPRIALKYDCLLHAMFAMSALEIAALSADNSHQEYVEHALRYQNLASVNLREELAAADDIANVPQEKHQAMWACSSILMVLGLALPRLQSNEKYSMLDHMMTYLKLMGGMVTLVFSKITSYKDDPLLCKYKDWDELDNLPLADGERVAIERLLELNDDIYGSTRERQDMPELQAVTHHAACRTAVFFLRQVYEKCRVSETRGYGLAWLIMAGADFIAAVNKREPLALLILMYWGVMLEQSSYGIWWLRDVGRKLIEDLSDEVYASGNAKMRDGLDWAREQVSIEPISR